MDNGKNSKINYELEIKDVDLIYAKGKENLKVLNNINMKIKESEFVCILGPSGCGKSTLLNIIAGFIKSSNGRVLSKGNLIEGPNWNRGVIFQDPVLYPWLSVYENVAFGLRMRKFPKDEIERLTDKYLRLVELEGFGANKPYELSGGMRQRVCLARILIGNPGIVLMDEPFGALDALTRDSMQNLIRKIWCKTKNTIFLVTHDIDEALLLGTRVILLSERPGSIIKEVDLDFTNKIGRDNYNDIIYSNEYKKIREEILGIIKS